MTVGASEVDSVLPADPVAPSRRHDHGSRVPARCPVFDPEPWVVRISNGRGAGSCTRSGSLRPSWEDGARAPVAIACLRRSHVDGHRVWHRADETDNDHEGRYVVGASDGGADVRAEPGGSRPDVSEVDSSVDEPVADRPTRHVRRRGGGRARGLQDHARLPMGDAGCLHHRNTRSHPALQIISTLDAASCRVLLRGCQDRLGDRDRSALKVVASAGPRLPSACFVCSFGGPSSGCHGHFMIPMRRA